MKILADQNLANIETLLNGLGEITLLPGRAINADSVQGQDALLVRSITRVDERLLTGSDLRFVGTATSGLDHIDLDYLKRHGIVLAHAAGSNADAVVDYCLAAMAYSGVFASQQRPNVGIVGFGQVGSRLHSRLSGMGIATQICDPLVQKALQEAGQPVEFLPLAELADCDVVSLRVPLTSTGPHASRHMIDSTFLASMRAEALLIHTCRGGVVNEQELLESIRKNKAPRCAIDVWEHEPGVNSELVDRVNYATPHIAGYSARAKLAASQLVVDQLHEFRAAGHEYEARATKPDYLAAIASANGCYPAAAGDLAAALKAGLNLPVVSEEFKTAVRLALPGELPASTFDEFRNGLRERGELSELDYRKFCSSELKPDERDFLRAAGFSLH